jgi:hypothetical protein
MIRRWHLRGTQTWVFVPWFGAAPTRVPVRCSPHQLGYWKLIRGKKEIPHA